MLLGLIVLEDEIHGAENNLFRCGDGRSHSLDTTFRRRGWNKRPGKVQLRRPGDLPESAGFELSDPWRGRGRALDGPVRIARHELHRRGQGPVSGETGRASDGCA